LSTRFTIIGGKGFVGSHLTRALEAAGETVDIPTKGDVESLKGSLGHVLYCAGTTSDFRQRPFDTIDAHVSLLSHVLRAADFESLTYLSSTRVYIRAESTAEDAVLPVLPSDPGDLFNLSKLAGEALCQQSGRAGVRAVRLSNVLGEDFQSDNFVFSLMRDARQSGSIHLQTTLDSEKDYIHIDDAVELILNIARRGKNPVYNVASGKNLSNREVVEAIQTAIPCTLVVDSAANSIRFAPIDTGLIKSEFQFKPRSIPQYIEELARIAPAVAVP
jgi:nucleoside-diphosphate-sugar epimerase